MRAACRVLVAVAGFACLPFLAAQQPTNAQAAQLARFAEFLKINFTNFPPVTFVAPTNKSEAVRQLLVSKKHVVGPFEDLYWSGFRFTLPAWLDGDFECLFVRVHQGNDPFRWANYKRYLISEDGEWPTNVEVAHKVLGEIPGWKEAYPKSDNAYILKAKLEHLRPGKAYLCWWAHTQPAPPDIVFTIGINSERGRSAYGSNTYLAAKQTLAENPVEFQGAAAFLKQNFSNFPLVTFRPPTNRNETPVQRFNVGENMVGPFNEGVGYTGVRFTMPEWMDGDLRWIFFHLNPPGASRQRVGVGWSLVNQSGEAIPLSPLRLDPNDDLEFWQRYPTTRRVYSFSVPRSAFKPGQGCAIALTHFGSFTPDVGFALTIDSERGQKEYGTLNYISGREGIPGAIADSSTVFLLRNFTRFPLIKLQPATNDTETAFQRLLVTDHTIGEFRGDYYTGVRFTVPEWVDGHLEFAFAHFYQPEDLPRRFGIKWGGVTERGKTMSIRKTDRIFVNDLPETAARFPNNEKVYSGIVTRENLTPGETCVFWWAHTKDVVPDIAFAFTILSERGRKEFGAITWR
jgi:hypothetical protein